MPIYGYTVSSKLHPPFDINSQFCVLISTHMLTNPIPADFSIESVKLLSSLSETTDNELLTSVPV